MAFLFPPRSNRPQVLAVSRWWSVTLHHQQLALCFHFQCHGTSFLSLTRPGHSFLLSGVVNGGGGGRRTEGHGEKKKKHAIYNHRVCFNALNKQNLASLWQEHLLWSLLNFGCHGVKMTEERNKRRTTFSQEEGTVFQQTAPTLELNVSSWRVLLN